MNKLIFENEITLYWDNKWVDDRKPVYKIMLDGKVIGATLKTHFSITDLLPQTTYKIAVLDCFENSEKIIYFEKLTTTQRKNYIDVTKTPYNAVGDGKTLNTKVLQKTLMIAQRTM